MNNEELHRLWIDKGQGMKALESVYQQGRADAIDELLKLSKAHSIYGYSIALVDLENIADRVKEQNET